MKRNPKYSTFLKRIPPARLPKQDRIRLLIFFVVICTMLTLTVVTLTKAVCDSEVCPHYAPNQSENTGDSAKRPIPMVSRKYLAMDSEIPHQEPDEPDVTIAQEALGEELSNTSAETAEETKHQKTYTERDIEVVAKTVYGEALITRSDMEMAAVVWCILNRVDSKGFACGGTIEYVTTFPRQFHGYKEDNPVTDHIRDLVVDVFERWSAEKNGAENVGRVLPKEYLFFWGDGRNNHFTTEYHGGETWNWEVENPYEN